jgi:hypothetical protein
VQELVVVAIANTMEEAKDYAALLKNNDIHAVIKQQQDEFTDSMRFAVMAPEETADEAHVVIESQDAYDDFYDSEVNDVDEDDFDAGIFDDEP